MTLLLRMEDNMNRQLTCEFTLNETPKSLADELVTHGFINSVSSLLYCRKYAFQLFCKVVLMLNAFQLTLCNCEQVASVRSSVLFLYQEWYTRCRKFSHQKLYKESSLFRQSRKEVCILYQPELLKWWGVEISTQGISQHMSCPI